jgi:hypothetical protein
MLDAAPGFAQNELRAGLCVEQWAGQNPLETTEAIIRAAFRRQGKPHQFLKYWVEPLFGLILKLK